MVFLLLYKPFLYLKMTSKDAQYYIDYMQLLPHPEGGWYKETYRSEELISTSGLPDRFSAARAVSTGIYFLLEDGNFSAFHRIKSDEMWHFYAGGTLEVFIIDKQGVLSVISLGEDLENGEVFQAVVKAGCWFASRPKAGVAFSLVGCTVAPGFDFDDFEMAERDALCPEYPPHQALINDLTR